MAVRNETVSPVPTPVRFSANRLQAVASDLTDTDWAVIHFLADVRLATGHQIARRLWAAASPSEPRARSARRALARLEHWRVIDRQARRMGGVRGGSSSIVYGLGRTAHRLLTVEGYGPRPHHDFGQPYIAHLIAITELVVQLSEADRNGAFELVGTQTEPRTWREFLTGFGAKQVLKPDLGATVGAGANVDTWWFEVDLSTESSAAIQRKARRYVDYFQSGVEQRQQRVFPRVAFLVPDQRRREQIQEALKTISQAPEGLFWVWVFDEAVGRLATEARS